MVLTFRGTASTANIMTDLKGKLIPLCTFAEDLDLAGTFSEHKCEPGSECRCMCMIHIWKRGGELENTYIGKRKEREREGERGKHTHTHTHTHTYLDFYIHTYIHTHI